MLRNVVKLALALSLAMSAPAAARPVFQLSDAQGNVHTSSEWAGRKAIVLFFILPDCPVTNSYVPEMNRIERAYARRGVLTYAVQADATASPGATAAYFREYRYEYPLLMDPQEVLVRLTGASVTPEVAVLSPEGKLLYRGRIDNRVEGFGSQRPQATVHELRDALEDILAGRPLRISYTQSVGCAITLIPQK